jgi:arsenate reductase
MSVKVYGYDKCGTCRNATKWLKANSIACEHIEVFQAPPTVEELEKLVLNSGLTVRHFFNVSGQVYKEMKLKDNIMQMSEQEQLMLLSSNGRLIKRPIVTDGTQVTLGFTESGFASVWKQV